MDSGFKITMTIAVVLGLALILGVGLRGCEKAGPGHVALKVKLVGEDRGVQDIIIETGWVQYWRATEDVVIFPTFVQRYVWTESSSEESPSDEAIRFPSKEGLNITSDVWLTYQVDPAAAPKFFVKYRVNDIRTFTGGQMRSIVREAFVKVGGQYAAEEIIGPKMAEIAEKVTQLVKEAVRQDGLLVENVGFVSTPRPPQEVVNAINYKVVQAQQALGEKNKIESSKAQAEQKIAQARGEAEANRILTQSISPQLIQWRQLEVMSSKWDGKLPLYGGGGGANLLLQVPGSR